MRIEINPRSLKNLEQICEMLYKLHPSVLNYLIDMERDIGCILGVNDGKNLSFEQREKLTQFKIKEDKEVEIKEVEIKEVKIKEVEDKEFKIKEVEDKKEPEEDEDYSFKKLVNILHSDGEYAEDIFVFKRLLKYLQLDTYEYIPIKIYVEVEDNVLGRKVRELVRVLERTDAPEQFYLHKREADGYAYFAEGYGLTMNEEQEKKQDDLYSSNDPEKLKKLLIKEKLYYY